MFSTSLGGTDTLRPLEPWHAGELLAHMDRARELTGRFISLPDRVHDLESSRAYLRLYADKARDDTGRLLGIWAADTLVGGVLLPRMDVAMGFAEAGCWLEPAAVGRGLVTRAARELIDWTITVRGMHRVEWHVASQNTASIAVAQRLGMTREGVLRQAQPHRGKRFDIEIWSVLASEWAASPPVRG